MALAAVVTLVATLGATAILASAAGTCANKVSKYMQLRFNAFVGQAIVANNKFCFMHPAGTYGPYMGVSGTTTPSITLPSRRITGLGESVELVGTPKLIYANSSRHTYRISVKHGPAYIPLRQTFDFDIHYYSYGLGRICFAGRGCGPYYRCFTGGHWF